MGKRIILVLAILALALGLIQMTPMAFLPKDGTDFVWGAAIGLWIGVIVNWFAARE